MPAAIGVNGGNADTIFETAVSVGLTDQVLIPRRTTRKFLQIINDSANVVYVSFGNAAAASTGTRLNANGGSLLMDRYVPQGPIRAIALTGASNVLVTEGV